MRIGLQASADEPEGDSPLRTCAVLRERRLPSELIRFVAGPDGTIVPDLACRLPGRGVWVTCDRKTVAAAVKTRAFARSLKREIKVAADLPDLVERLILQRTGGAFGIAKKAGLVLAGFTKVDTAIAGGTAVALVHGCDASVDGADRLDRRFNAMCRDSGLVPRIVRALTIEQISLALGRANVVHAALTRGGAAELFLDEAGRLGRFRSGMPDPAEPRDDRDTASVRSD